MVRREIVLGRQYIACKDALVYGEFETRMLEENLISGLIRPEIYWINGSKEYYFNVTDKVSFEDMLVRDIVRIEDIKRLLKGLNQTVNCLQEYLIDADVLLLETEYIYFSKEAVLFAYDLSERRQFSEGVVSLVKNILDKIDYDNRELVLLCYKIFDMVSSSQSNLQKIIDVLDYNNWSIKE